MHTLTQTLTHAHTHTHTHAHHAAAAAAGAAGPQQLAICDARPRSQTLYGNGRATQCGT
jgi:hypothetical protein